MIGLAILVTFACGCETERIAVNTRDLSLQIDARGRLVSAELQGTDLSVRPEPIMVFGDAEALSKKLGPELLPNGSFETDADGDGTPDRWQVGGNWSWSRLAHTGARSMMVEMPRREELKPSGDIYSPRIAVQPSSVYRLEFWARTEDCGGRYPPTVYVLQFDADGQSCVPQIPVAARKGTNDWFLVGKTFWTSPYTRYVQVYANIWAGWGKAWLDDLSIRSLPTLEARPMELSARRADTGLVLSGRPPESGVRIKATLSGNDERVFIRCRLQDLTGKARRIVAGLQLPVDLSGWTWHDNILWSRRVTERPLRWCMPTEFGNGRLSIYPFQTLTCGRRGLVVAVPPEQGPRIYEGRASSRGIKLLFYLALAPQVRKWPSSAAFEAEIYPCEGKWGMRAAAQRFYRLHPEHFRRRQPNCAYLNYAGLEPVLSDGSFRTIRDGGRPVPDACDFGDWLPCFVHLHCGYACDWWRREDHTRPTDEQVWQFLTTRPGPHARRLLEYTPRWALRRKITLDDQGRIRYHRCDWFPKGERYARDTRSGWFFEFRVHEDPEICRWIPDYVDERWRRWLKLPVRRRPWEVFLSSDEILGYTGTGSPGDFRPDHLPFADVPLSWHRETLALGRSHLAYDLLRTFIGPDSARRAYLVIGNSNNFNRFFCARYVDVAMIEWDWDRTRPIRTCIYAKTIFPFRTYRFWRVCGKGEKDSASILEHFRRALLWGIYPCVWAIERCGPGLEAWRAIYRLCVPVMERLDRAGFRPVTLAAVAPRSVLVERFGDFADGSLHFTLRNTTDRPVQASLSIDAASLGFDSSCRRLVVQELLTGSDMAHSVKWRKQSMRVSLAIPARSVRVLSVAAPRGRALWALSRAADIAGRIERAFPTVREAKPVRHLRQVLARLRHAIAGGKGPDFAPPERRDIAALLASTRPAIVAWQQQVPATAPSARDKLFLRLREELGVVAAELADVRLFGPRLLPLQQGKRALSFRLTVAGSGRCRLSSSSLVPQVSVRADLVGTGRWRSAQVQVGLPSQEPASIVPVIVTAVAQPAGYNLETIHTTDLAPTPAYVAPFE